MEKKGILRRKSTELIEQGNKLKDEHRDAKVVTGWWSSWREKRRVKGLFTRYKVAVLTLERDYEIFKLEL